MKPDATGGQLSFDISPIKWRKPGEGTFWFVESKHPDGFRVDCVTEDGHYANPKATYLMGRLIAQPGAFYRATAHTGAAPISSKLCESIDEAKEQCEVFRLHGRFTE